VKGLKVKMKYVVCSNISSCTFFPLLSCDNKPIKICLPLSNSHQNKKDDAFSHMSIYTNAFGVYIVH